MLAAEDCVLILLAAGRSERFGGVASKLDQPFLGRPLGLHAVVALAGVPFRERVAVVGELDLNYGVHGFTVLPHPNRHLGMGSSMKLGVRRAVEIGAGSVLIALADMPRITAAHVRRLFDASRDGASVVASSDGRAAKPPALFGASRFDALLALDDSAGARALVQGGHHVVTTPAELVDVDTVEALDQLRRLVHDPAVQPSSV